MTLVRHRIGIGLLAASREGFRNALYRRISRIMIAEVGVKSDIGNDLAPSSGPFVKGATSTDRVIRPSGALGTLTKSDLRRREESENLTHQPLSLIGLENKLGVCRTFENHQLFWVRGFFVLRTNVS